jgi:hypothetical protein
LKLRIRQGSQTIEPIYLKMHFRNKIGIILIVLLFGIIISGCSEEYPEIERESKIPDDIGKIRLRLIFILQHYIQMNIKNQFLLL